MELRVLIVDDEALPAKYLRELLVQNFKEIGVIKIINDPVYGLEIIQNEQFDILFLDVEMPKLNGIEFRKMTTISEETTVIYTTAYEHYAVEAFKVNASGYLLKPIDLVELKQVINNVKKYKQLLSLKKANPSHNNFLKVFDGEDYVVLKYSDIIRLQADGSYTKVYLENESVLVTKRIGEILKDLKSGYFLRCHKSHVVNREKIEAVNKSKAKIKLIGDFEVPYSKSYKEEVDKVKLQ